MTPPPLGASISLLALLMLGSASRAEEPAPAAAAAPPDQALPPPPLPPPSASATRAASGLAPRGLLVFYGNLVLPNEVYLAVLDLPPACTADYATSVVVRDQLQDFLMRAGYDLARVETLAEGGRIYVDIDEGRLEKVVFRGTGSLKTVQALVALSLPQSVFNRPYLERRLLQIRETLGVDVERWELRQATAYDQLGPQLDDLEDLAKPLTPLVSPVQDLVEGLGSFVGHSLIPPRGDYELHILFRRKEWSTGAGIFAGLSGSDGLKLGARYRGERLVFTTDRWSTGAQLGLKVRNSLIDQHSYVAIQRALAEIAYYTPAVLGELRPMLLVRGELLSRQRPDVNLESYNVTRAQAVLALSYDLIRLGNITLGIGGERNDVFRLKDVDKDLPRPAGVRRDTHQQPYISTSIDLVFDVDELRADRLHELKIEGRQYPGTRGSAYGVATLAYQKIFAIGWHDIELGSRGAYVWGHPPFFEEVGVGGTYVRGVFDTRFYTTRVISGTLALRYSLTRDIYKVGCFADVALFGDLNRADYTDRARVAASVGPSFHALIADSFQLSIYYANGLVTRDQMERGFGVSLKQAF